MISGDSNGGGKGDEQMSTMEVDKGESPMLYRRLSHTCNVTHAGGCVTGMSLPAFLG